MLEVNEEISSLVHNAWLEQKIKDNYHHPSKCDKVSNPTPYRLHCSKCNADMIPYDQLTDKDKEYVKTVMNDIMLDLQLFLYKITKEMKE